MSITMNKAISCFYETSEDCVKLLDTSGILMSFNGNGLKIMEIDTAEDVIGTSWLSFWEGDLKIPAERALEQAKKGVPGSFEGYCPTAKGTMKFWHVSLVPLLADDGSVESILVTSKDSTELNELRKKVKQLEAVADTQA